MDFKHGTLVFCRVLSGLYQQEVISTKKKDLLLKEWQTAIKHEDTAAVKKLLNEMKVTTENRKWRTEIAVLLEELA